MKNNNIKIKVDRLNIHYGTIHALKGVSLDIYQNEILGAIGPANSGKTSFLRMLNRLNDIHPKFRFEGHVFLDQIEIYKMDSALLRKRIGMVFALPLPLPLSIFDNVAYGPRMHGIRNKVELSKIVEKSLKAAFLWDEVKDRLNESGFKLSGGQQQRLCIARTLAVEPEVILFDEPCSGLDPISTGKIEEAMVELKKKYTLVLVTNNTKQAARVSDRVAFFLMGSLVEIGPTDQLFTNPSDARTGEYITGRFG
ncbi:MAG: phosphate ABC transporter ATP-binding protein [Chlamydiae bacterium]|nr:phosphate ABC transporter ATP-binding protein [Chlamydiota bacterium]MBI3277091.1 phosphate ABC transporter ATP-binding protein [Chlamydiota bacterium]